MNKHRHQDGVFLLEALIAILIFALGILGMVSMGSAAIAGQTDSQMRVEAINYASEISSKVALNVDRTPGNFASSIAAFQHLPTVTDGYCSFTGTASTQPIVVAWIARMTSAGGLPGASATSESIEFAPSANGNKLTVTVCWKPPSTAISAPMHRQVLVSYIN